MSDMNIPSVDMDELHPGGEVPESPDDRGETPYFHGCKNILDKFQDRLFKSFSNSGNGGTILLFQGPPGVGKTALLAECCKIAEANGWITAEINPEALWDMRSLKHCLGTARGGKVKEVNIGANMSIFGVNIGVVFNQDAPLPLEALTGDHEPLLLILDEAQRLGKPRMPPAGKIEDATTILENIHNGKMKRPLVLLTAGLGDTLQGFQSLFISRFKNNCYYELKALTKGEEQAIIEDWFQKQGRVTGDMTEWTHRIMEETYG